MPCYTINTVSLSLKATNRGLLHRAAQKLGLEMLDPNTLRTKQGRTIKIDGENAVCDPRDQDLVNKLRVGYSNEVVSAVSQKLGWQKVVKGTNKYTLKKGF